MNVVIRAAQADDAETCGRICFAAFRVVSERHGFPSPFRSVAAATFRVTAFIHHPAVFGLVAASDQDDQVVGFAFLSERDPMRAVGPVAIDPTVQRQGLGRRLMKAALERAEGARGVRLMQDTFNMSSLALYASLGFEAKELCVIVTGVPASAPWAAWDVRLMAESDLEACEALHQTTHGYTRTNELRETLATGSPVVALRDGKVRAYMAVPTIWLGNHGVAQREVDMQALILGATRLAGGPPSFLLPIRNSQMLCWCLRQGMRTIKPMTLMASGEYQQPKGAYIPSVLY
ncbi:GNAT family N-acetyltransferase [Alsobacter sp. SYSU BS001988]